MRKRGAQVRLPAYVIRFIQEIQANEAVRTGRRPSAGKVIQKLIPKNWKKYYDFNYR